MFYDFIYIYIYYSLFYLKRSIKLISTGYTWQVIEDFNGHLYLIFLNKNHECIFFNKNYERNFSQLVKDLDSPVEIQDNANTLYLDLISKDSSAWWVIADTSDIYWDEMGTNAYKNFKQYNNDFLWIYR